MQPKPAALLITYFEFRVRLSEWLDEATILRYQAEIFGLYASAYSVRAVALFIQEKESTNDSL